MKISFETLDKYLPLKSCGEIVAVMKGEVLRKLVEENWLKVLRNTLSEFNGIAYNADIEMDADVFDELGVEIEDRNYYIGIMNDEIMLERHKTPGLWIYNDKNRVEGYPLICIWERK